MSQLSLRHYFKPVNNSPNPCGPLSSSLSSGAIRDANRAVMESIHSSKPTSRGTYTRFTPEEQAKIAEYAILHGNKAAIRYFSKELGRDIKDSSLSTWKGKYKNEIRRMTRHADSSDDAMAVCIHKLPMKRRGRPLLLGQELDSQVKAYIEAVRQAGGVITTSITMAAATAIVRRSDRNLLSDNGGPITITANWAKSLLYRLNFVKRRGSSASKISVTNFEELKEQYLLNIKAVVEMEEIPSALVFNWDQIGISIVPGSSWTLEKKGSKRVEIIGISDKRQITAVICGTMNGQILPFQLIYQGKTGACLPQYTFPEDWDVTSTSNHWSNEEKMKQYLDKIIVPYVQATRCKLQLPPEYPALAIFDVFRGQVTDDVFAILRENNIHVVKVPANCTDRLQPMDLSVNKSVKEFLRQKFQAWYSSEVQKQLDQGVEEVDLRMSIMKPLGAQWLTSLYDHLQANETIVRNGFKAAGILDIVNDACISS